MAVWNHNKSKVVYTAVSYRASLQTGEGRKTSEEGNCNETLVQPIYTFSNVKCLTDCLYGRLKRLNTAYSVLCKLMCVHTTANIAHNRYSSPVSLK